MNNNNKIDQNLLYQLHSACNKDNDYPFEQTFWDDWCDYRDGFRGSQDKSLISKISTAKK